jgi:hypothetical protein
MFLMTLGCSGSDSSFLDGPSTICKYTFGAATVPSDFGTRCETNEECAHGFCMTPDSPGNITNNVFSFCSRGCDCNDAPESSVSGQDQEYDCVYPGGCFPGTSNGSLRHAVKECVTLQDCLDVDPAYTHCATTDTLTTIPDTSCGQLHKVCQAHL